MFSKVGVILSIWEATVLYVAFPTALALWQ